MNEHLITTNIEGKKALRVFESFETDVNLPKFKDRVNLTATQQISMSNIVSSGAWAITGTNINNVIWGVDAGVGQSYPPPKKSFWSAWWECMQKARADRKKKHEEKVIEARAIPVTTIFEAILGGGKKLQNLTARLDDYKKSIEYAKSMGQTALAEKLAARLPIIESEAVLVCANCTQFIEEEQLIDFIVKCERGLRLDWVKNFIRLVPPNVQVKKVKLDELRVFDNYTILHYDPESKAVALTKKEIEKKKDPIMFGLVQGSRRLYHVGSWKDEFCDLTFADMVEKYGKDVLTLK